MSATDLDEALLALFLLSDREGVTADQLKRAIERVREEWRGVGQRMEGYLDD